MSSSLTGRSHLSGTHGISEIIQNQVSDSGSHERSRQRGNPPKREDIDSGCDEGKMKDMKRLFQDASGTWHEANPSSIVHSSHAPLHASTLCSFNTPKHKRRNLLRISEQSSSFRLVTHRTCQGKTSLGCCHAIPDSESSDSVGFFSIHFLYAMLMTLQIVVMAGTYFCMEYRCTMSRRKGVKEIYRRY